MAETVGKYLIKIDVALEGVVDKPERRQFSLLLFDFLRGYSRADLLLRENELLTSEETDFLDDAIARLKQHEPIQYILGRTEFLGLPFKVDRRVLIPRPETEELVLWILDEGLNETIDLLDIGTGSGCIPITLKKHWSNARVETWDISEDALELAASNARLNDVEVQFSCKNALTEIPPPQSLDIIVSNPPYVTDKEKTLMADNVLDFEPHSALFVANDKPLLFYDAIALLATHALRNGGRLYFEINEAYGTETVDMLNRLGFSDIELRKDLFGKNRMIRATWPGVS